MPPLRRMRCSKCLKACENFSAAQHAAPRETKMCTDCELEFKTATYKRQEEDFFASSQTLNNSNTDSPELVSTQKLQQQLLLLSAANVQQQQQELASFPQTSTTTMATGQSNNNTLRDRTKSVSILLDDDRSSVKTLVEDNKLPKQQTATVAVSCPKCNHQYCSKYFFGTDTESPSCYSTACCGPEGVGWLVNITRNGGKQGCCCNCEKSYLLGFGREGAPKNCFMCHHVHCGQTLAGADKKSVAKCGPRLFGYQRLKGEVASKASTTSDDGPAYENQGFCCRHEGSKFTMSTKSHGFW